MTDDSLLSTLAGFARSLTGEYSVDDVMAGLANRVTDALGLLGAGVALRDGEGISFASASRESIAALESLQAVTQQGPCADAIRLGRVVTVADLSVQAAHMRWPVYADEACRRGVVAVAGLPMLAGGVAVGAMNLYSKAARAWSEQDLQAAQVFTDVATSFLVHASRLAEQRKTAQQLQFALDSRVVIEQAKGILAATHDISIGDAFQRLRKYARDHNAPIREVAAAVVRLELKI